MKQQHCQLYPFLKAVHGNWHNAIFLQCCHRHCPYGHLPPCQGFLVAADADQNSYDYVLFVIWWKRFAFGILAELTDGTAVGRNLMPAETFRELTGDIVFSEECRSVLSLQAFETAYSLYLEWHTISSYGCPIRQLCQDSESKPFPPNDKKDVIPP